MNKVVVLEYILSLYDGGAEIIAKDYCINLDKSKFTPIYCAFNRDCSTAVYDLLTKNNIHIEYLYNRWNIFIKIFSKPFRKIINRYKIIKIIERNRVNVIHVHLTHLNDFKYLTKYLKKKNIKIIYTCHSFPSSLFGGKHKREYNAAVKLIKYNNLQMIAIESSMVEDINNLFNINNCIHVYNAIDIERFKNICESKEQIRNDLCIPTNAFVVGQVGRFVKYKNQKFTLEIFKEINNINKNSYLIFVGSGKEKEYIKTYANYLSLDSKVLFLENRSDIPQILKSMDLFLYPALYEGLGIVLIEAQVAGIKVITSDTISKDVYISDKIKSMSLEQSAYEWAISSIYDNSIGKPLTDINNYDIKRVIKTIENIYSL